MTTKIETRVTSNLPQLQNFIRKDPEGYREEFKAQYQHYESVYQILLFNPSYLDSEFESLVVFLANTCPCYKKEMVSFPEQLINLLQNYSTGLHRTTRMACCKALIILRSRNFIELKDLLPLFFELSRCPDKALRAYIKQNIISDIRASNKKTRNEKYNKELQRYMYSKLANDQQETPALLALEIMTSLYLKNIWTSRDLVNQIAQACLSRSTKILIAALQFLLGADEIADKEDKDSDNEEDEKHNALNQLKETLMANKFNKSTRKRQKILDKVKKTIRTVNNKEKKPETCNFSALYLINDPQTLADKLLIYLESTSEKFEVKLMIMNLISRLIGIHELIVLNFYSILVKYIQPHQIDVTKVLQYAAQSSHKDVPADELEPVLKAITNNFVNEKNSTEAITVGLNSIRELCARNPSVMNADLLQDLAQYQKYKNKNVSMASKSLINLFRVKNPELLARKDRGRPIVQQAEMEEIDSEDPESECSSDMDIDMDEDGYEEEGEEEEDEIDDDDEVEEEGSLDESDALAALGEDPSDKVRLEDIEKIYKRPKHNKESRLATVIEGREGRGKFGGRKPKLNEHASTSNRDKRRNKAFGMIKHKLKRHKKKKTFHEKQIELKQKLLNRERSKRK